MAMGRSRVDVGIAESGVGHTAWHSLRRKSLVPAPRLPSHRLRPLLPHLPCPRSSSTPPAICPYCHRAKRLLTQKGASFEEIDVSGDWAARDALAEKAGGLTTVPQIWIGDTHVGGSDELARPRPRRQARRAAGGLMRDTGPSALRHRLYPGHGAAARVRGERRSRQCPGSQAAAPRVSRVCRSSAVHGLRGRRVDRAAPQGFAMRVTPPM